MELSSAKNVVETREQLSQFRLATEMTRRAPFHDQGDQKHFLQSGPEQMRDSLADIAGQSALLFLRGKNSRAGGQVEVLKTSQWWSSAALWGVRTRRQHAATALMLTEGQRGNDAGVAGGGFRTLIVVAQNNDCWMQHLLVSRVSIF
jgi:hypothetical protein